MIRINITMKEQQEIILIRKLDRFINLILIFPTKFKI